MCMGSEGLVTIRGNEAYLPNHSRRLTCCHLFLSFASPSSFRPLHLLDDCTHFHNFRDPNHGTHEEDLAEQHDHAATVRLIAVVPL